MPPLPPGIGCLVQRLAAVRLHLNKASHYSVGPSPVYQVCRAHKQLSCCVAVEPEGEVSSLHALKQCHQVSESVIRVSSSSPGLSSNATIMAVSSGRIDAAGPNTTATPCAATRSLSGTMAAPTWQCSHLFRVISHPRRLCSHNYRPGNTVLEPPHERRGTIGRSE